MIFLVVSEIAKVIVSVPPIPGAVLYIAYSGQCEINVVNTTIRIVKDYITYQSDVSNLFEFLS